jgi:hypothetical protein
MKARVNGIVLEPYFPRVRALDQKDEPVRVSRAAAREFNKRHRRRKGEKK